MIFWILASLILLILCFRLLNSEIGNDRKKVKEFKSNRLTVFVSLTRR